LLVERLTVPYASPNEFWPFRDDWEWILLLGKKAPQRGMMPAELMASAVSMGANATAELLDLRDELLA
jgi:hypothetical protein